MSKHFMQHCGDETHPMTFPLPPRSERPEAAEHRQRILDVARALFATRGVEGVSMHQIAQAAGVGQGTLYRRYAHKGELCMDLMRAGSERFWHEMEAYRTQGDIPALERLDQALTCIISLVDEKAPYFCTMGDASFGERRALQYNAPFYRWLHGVIVSLLDEAVARGELPPLDATFTADAVLAALKPDLYLFQRQERGFTREQILHGVRRIFIEGLHTRN